MLESFFNPQTIAIVGLSSDPNKIGSLILRNLQRSNYSGYLCGVNGRYANGYVQKLQGVDCYGSLREIPKTIDLAIIAIPAKAVENTVDDCIAAGVKNISIISAGFGEVGNRDLENSLARKCSENGINLLGPNCLGHISTYNNINASFADGFPPRGNIAFISQSGAYCSAMLDWASEKNIGFSHFISIGNKALLSENELLLALKDDKNTDAFILYLESLRNGTEFLKIAKTITTTKPLILLEPGKSSKAQAASLSHTGSLAPNFRVLREALREAGVIQVFNSRELFGLVELLHFTKHGKFNGKLGVITNAGGVGVLSGDLCEENGISMTEPTEATKNKLRSALTAEAAVANPIDILGDAGADRYEKALRILCESGEYEDILVLLTPQMATDALGTAKSVLAMANDFKDINIFTSFMGGAAVREGINMLKQSGILNFDYPVDCISLLGLLKKNERMNETTHIVKSNINGGNPIPIAREDILESVRKAKEAGLTSLPQSTVSRILEFYGIDFPKSDVFDDRERALDFCSGIFPNPVVLKISAPDALHKTEMRGIYLHIDGMDKFNEAWKGLQQSSIEKFHLKNAKILVQEMIQNASEVLIGVNGDRNFGKIMVFGTGGVNTEVIGDSSLRIIPTDDFDSLIDETKMGVILRGIRGQKPKAVDKLKDTLKKVQQLVLDIPALVSIDINPALVTEDRVVVVDFKGILRE